MQHMFDSINPADMTLNATGVFSSMSPLIALLLGVLFTFLIIDSIIQMLQKSKDNKTYIWRENKNIDDDDDDDFPY